MAYVITDPCIAVCDTACVKVCPVDAIHGPAPSGQLVIDPIACICCGMCEPECPVSAIFDEPEVPAHHRAAIARNAEFFEKPRMP